jgi:hypothetical protein
MKIPQNVWAEICVLFRVSILISLLLALLLNTSLSFTLPCIICLVFYNLVIIVGHRYRVRVQVVACSKVYLHIIVMLSKVYGPESQLPLPALGSRL